MATTISNQATLSYQYSGQSASAASNIATALLTDPVTLSKVSLESSYQAGGELTFAVNFVNGAGTALNDITVTDNMGTYALGAGSVTPLFIDSLAMLFIDGVYSGALTPTPGINSVSFTVPALAAGSNAEILYTAKLNDIAPLAVGSAITNTVTLTATGLVTPVTASSTVTVADYANVTISKSMCPASVTDGSQLTYNFEVYNYGNTEATDIVLTDTFSPAPTAITVSVNGTTVPPANYTYAGGVLTLPTGGAYTLSLPPATFTQDPSTGVITTAPSTMTISVVGTL